jgi:hypothetical protein
VWLPEAVTDAVTEGDSVLLLVREGEALWLAVGLRLGVSLTVGVWLCVRLLE